MKIYRNKTTKTITLDDIRCDMCGKSCYAKDGIDFECSNLSSSWGYNSKKDGDVWNSDYCEECSDKIKQFIIDNGGVVRSNNGR